MLNLSTLRKRNYPSASQLASDNRVSERGRLISRREMLGITGVAAVGATPILGVLRAALSGTVSFTYDRLRAAFSLDGAERWVIDVRRFGGAPRLDVHEERDRVLLSLNGALFPGTQLPADFNCELTRNAGRWRMRLQLALTESVCETPFAPWLGGETTARYVIARDWKASLASSDTALTILSGDALTFYPNWSLHAEGSRVSRLLRATSEFSAGAALIRLLDSNEPSLLRHPMAKRTLIEVPRGGAVWGAIPELTTHGGTLSALHEEPFDRAQVEMGETASGSRGVLLFDTSGGPPTLSFRPGQELTSYDGTEFALPLTGARFAVGLNDSTARTALVAEFADEPRELLVGGCRLQVGRGINTAPFELTTAGGRVENLTCQPQLLDVSAPLPDASIISSHAPANTRLVFRNAARRTDKGEEERASVGETAGQVEVVVPLSEKVVVRAEDLLVLRFKFKNLQLKLTQGSGARIVVKNPAAESTVTVLFQPQHFGEEHFPEKAPPGPGTKVRARMAGSSRLSFVVHDAGRGGAAAAGIPYTMEGILDACRSSRLKIKGAGVGKPADEETAIEAPYRLILSPNEASAWLHSACPVTQFRPSNCSAQAQAEPARTELWHTRLGLRDADGRVTEGDNEGRTLRAVWARDMEPGAPPVPFNILPKAKDREDLVRLTSELKVGPIKAQRLMLSALGAWMRVGYDSGRPVGSGVDLELWLHQAAMGRDQYVKVVTAGYLYPWRHSASHVQIVERLFIPVGDRIEAVLLLKQFLVVKMPRTIVYPAQPGVRNEGRRMLPQVTILEEKEIRIYPKSVEKPCEPAAADAAYFWPDIDDKECRHLTFRAQALDYRGGLIEFAPTAIFVRASVVEETAELPAAIWDGYLSDPSRDIDLRNQQVAFAPPQGNENTVVDAGRITFSSEHVPAASLPAGQRHAPKFFPVIERVAGHIPAFKQLTADDTQVALAYNGDYVSGGFNAATNPGKVFMEVRTPLRLDFRGQTDKPGAFFRPRLNVVGLSALTGIVGGGATDSPDDPNSGLQLFRKGTFSPKRFFESLELFGTEDLRDYAEEVAIPAALDKVPRLSYTKTGAGASVKVEAQFRWHAEFKTRPEERLEPKPVLDFDASRSTVLGTGERPHIRFKCELDRYVTKTRDVRIRYGKLVYWDETGRPTIVEAPIPPTIDGQPGVRFEGDLGFVQTLTELFRTTDLKAESHVSDGVLTLSFGARRPDINFGLFRLHNLSVYTLISIGYLGTRFGVEFKIASPSSPCALTVGPFYGKAYFVARWSLSPTLALLGFPPAFCLPSVDTGFEFGAQLGFDIGIASFSLSVSAGFRFQLNMEYSIQLTGYLHCHGSMSVGPVSAGVGFDAQLILRGNELYCEADLRISVDLFLFSIDHTERVRFSFRGSPSILVVAAVTGTDGDGQLSAAHHAPAAAPGQRAPALAPPAPSFAEQISEDDWELYCEAFA